MYLGIDNKSLFATGKENMKILILGGTRFFGKTTANILSGLGHDVVTVSRSALPLGQIRHAICDRKDQHALEHLLQKETPDAILDMVCFDQGDGLGVTKLFDSGFMASVGHYIMVSSFFVYNSSTKPEMEFSGDLAEIGDGYTRRKIEAENTIHGSELFKSTSILRLPFVFAHDDYSDRFQKFCTAVSRKRIGQPDNSLRTSMISKDDAANLLASLVVGLPIGFADGSNEGCLSLYEIAQEIARTLGVQIEGSNDDEISEIYGLQKDLCLNSSKTKKLKGLKQALATEANAWKSINQI
jgi:nucleoside-diphosphate-sugar epimerase